MERAQIALRLEAFAVCMRIKSQTLARGDIADLRGSALRYEGHGDALSRAVGELCDAVDRADSPDEARCAAEQMIHWIDATNMPTPPGQSRRDIHG